MNYLGGVVIACVLVCEVTAIAVKNDGGSKALYVFCWDGQKKEREPAKKELPTFKIKDGQEKVSLFKIYKVAKWDLGIPNSPSYIPDEGTEVYVVRFYREALSPGSEIAKHAVTVVDTKNVSGAQ